MLKRELRAHKDAPKQLAAVPVFKAQARNKLPRPFKGLGGPRIQSTGLLKVSSDHTAFMYWRDGPIFTDRGFFGYLFCVLANGDLSPIFEFHWHPSHKGFHCKTPCNTTSNFTNRCLPGAPEFSLTTNDKLDPQNEDDRLKLVIAFCEGCGIFLPDTDQNRHRLI